MFMYIMTVLTEIVKLYFNSCYNIDYNIVFILVLMLLQGKSF